MPILLAGNQFKIEPKQQLCEDQAHLRVGKVLTETVPWSIAKWLERGTIVVVELLIVQGMGLR